GEPPLGLGLPPERGGPEPRGARGAPPRGGGALPGWRRAPPRPLGWLRPRPRGDRVLARAPGPPPRPALLHAAPRRRLAHRAALAVSGVTRDEGRGRDAAAPAPAETAARVDGPDAASAASAGSATSGTSAPALLTPGAEPWPYLTADIPAIPGTLKARYEDFVVEEIPLYEPEGRGDHVHFVIEKAGLTTHKAVADVARALGVHPRNIGFAGLKDARAVTRQ